MFCSETDSGAVKDQVLINTSIRPSPKHTAWRFFNNIQHLKHIKYTCLGFGDESVGYDERVAEAEVVSHEVVQLSKFAGLDLLEDNTIQSNITNVEHDTIRRTSQCGTFSMIAIQVWHHLTHVGVWCSSTYTGVWQHCGARKIFNIEWHIL